MKHTKGLPVGFYDLLHTVELQKRLEEEGLLDRAVWSRKDIEADELKRQLALPLARSISAFMGDVLLGKMMMSLRRFSMKH